MTLLRWLWVPIGLHTHLCILSYLFPLSLFEPIFLFDSCSLGQNNQLDAADVSSTIAYSSCNIVIFFIYYSLIAVPDIFDIDPVVKPSVAIYIIIYYFVWHIKRANQINYIEHFCINSTAFRYNIWLIVGSIAWAWVIWSSTSDTRHHILLPTSVKLMPRYACEKLFWQFA